MKPILHIINNPDDTQAIEIIKTQGNDNAYGVAAVFIGEAPSLLPSMPDVRICVLRKDDGSENNPPIPPFSKGGDYDLPPLEKGGQGGFEVIGYDDLLNLIFSVESITVW